jgi:hypothetical protein
MMSTNKPNQKRRRAVIVSLDEEVHGFRIRIDDVISDTNVDDRWVQDVHVTSRVVPHRNFVDVTISEADLADFGAYVFARLNAFYKRKEN